MDGNVAADGCGLRGPDSVKIDIIRLMKLLAMVLLLPVAALAVTVEPLPQYGSHTSSTAIRRL